MNEDLSFLTVKAGLFTKYSDFGTLYPSIPNETFADYGRDFEWIGDASNSENYSPFTMTDNNDSTYLEMPVHQLWHFSPHLGRIRSASSSRGHCDRPDCSEA